MNVNEIRAHYAPDLRAFYGRDAAILTDAEVARWAAIRGLGRRRESPTTFRDEDASTIRI